MARGRKPRTWVKIDCEGILRGSINYLLPLEGQAIWIKMIAYSEICGGRPGYIEDNNQNGLPTEYLAQELHCSLEAFKLVIDKMTKDGAVEVNGTGAIHLVNFTEYQFSEYDRQKGWRQQKREKQTQDADKYKAGHKGSLVVTSTADLELVKNERARRNKKSDKTLLTPTAS